MAGHYLSCPSCRGKMRAAASSERASAMSQAASRRERRRAPAALQRSLCRRAARQTLSVALLALAEGEGRDGRALVFQRSSPLTARPPRRGVFGVDQLDAAWYGGIVSWRLDGTSLHADFADEAAAALTSRPGIAVELTGDVVDARGRGAALDPRGLVAQRCPMPSCQHDEGLRRGHRPTGHVQSSRTSRNVGRYAADPAAVPAVVADAEDEVPVGRPGAGWRSTCCSRRRGRGGGAEATSTVVHGPVGPGPVEVDPLAPPIAVLRDGDPPAADVEDLHRVDRPGVPSGAALGAMSTAAAGSGDHAAPSQ